MNKDQSEEWLALSGVAEMIGVHPSTVRVWSDKGVFPVHRTSGGHRRYRRHEVEMWLKTSRSMHTIEPSEALQIAIGKIRMQIADGRLEAESWYQKLDETARAQYRPSGRILAYGLMNFLAGDDVNAAAEAYAVGYDYASRARRYGLSSVDATRAFLFFRNNLLEALINAYEDACISPGMAWSRMLNRVHAFSDQILVHLLETYQVFEEVGS